MDEDLKIFLCVAGVIATIIAAIAVPTVIGNNVWNAHYAAITQTQAAATADVAKACIAAGKTWEVARSSANMVCDDGR